MQVSARFHDSPFSITVDKPWRDTPDVCARTHEQEEDEDEGLEIEERRLEVRTELGM
jgi:hypothetical protein